VEVNLGVLIGGGGRGGYKPWKQMRTGQLHAPAGWEQRAVQIPLRTGDSLVPAGSRETYSHYID
jgi:hypothetical protein